MYEGRFFDGKTAAEQNVRARFETDGLTIDTAAGSVFWPRKGIDATPSGANVRFTSKSDRDARLILASSEALNADLKRLRLDAAARQKRALMLGGSLIAAGAALAALIFVGAPLAAEPLARATPTHVETQLGENLTRQIHVWMRPCENTATADAAIAPLVAQIARQSDAGFDVRLSFVRSPAPNAFALPGGRVFVTSGLLETLEHPDELAAVVAHEIGHVDARDSMISLYRHMGLGLFLEAVTGGTGVAQQLLILSGQLAELRYTRAQETRADVFAIAAMNQSGLDPEALARAFERLTERVEELRNDDIDLDAPEWLMSHPNTGARIDAARAAARPATATALSDDAWAQVRAACATDEAPK